MKMKYWNIFILFITLSFTWTCIKGDLESTLARCCALGANWAREGQKCALFPKPVPHENIENQQVCSTSASICCLRFYRETQCENGKQAAKSGLQCVTVAQPGGEYFKDCCDGCQLGIAAGEKGIDCRFRGFTFGHPWNEAYLQCCIGLKPELDNNFITVPPDTEFLKYPELSEDDDDFIFTNRVDGDIEISDSENLCLLFSGQLCGQICIPTRGSYICKCRQAFTLSVDGKTCLQAHITDRCRENNPCEHSCLDSGTSIECSCKPGYQLNTDHTTCKDINECRDNSNPCGLRETCVNTPGSFRCIPGRSGSTRHRSPEGVPDCPVGYKFNAQVQTCEDVDECSEGSHTCSKTSQSCMNTIGSFQCKQIEGRPTCDLGYAFNLENKACEDINECETGLHLCSAREVCVNLPGAYICDRKQPLTIRTTTSTKTTTSTTTRPRVDLGDFGSSRRCSEGYEYNSFFKTCTEINECESNPCTLDEQCVNTPGSYQCTCQDGFKRDDNQICRDINECQIDRHDCPGWQRCDNTIGSFTCTRVSGCGTGYTLNQNTEQCEDNDECTLGTADCSQLGPKWNCVNTKGSFRCERKRCPDNQILNSWGRCVNVTCTLGFEPINKICVDINECFVGTGVCKLNERCRNTVGSFRCFPKINCNRGYVMNERGTLCEDIDECADGTHECDVSQQCMNRQGGYVCQCQAGHRLEGSRKCVDIDECTEYYTNVCGINGNCENTIGSYQCDCNEGYKKTQNGLSCNDIDECREIANICDHNCVNVWGSHYCTCNTGYQLDKDNRTCVDTDECSEMIGRGRLCLGQCVNTRGSFKCQCPPGYELEPDQRTCRDLDECDDIGVCRGVDEICVNTRGSHRCEKLSCPQNYQRDPNHRNRCKRQKQCLDTDLECRRLPLTYSFNFLPLAANMSLKPTGAVDLFTLRGPLWSSTNNVNFELELEYARSMGEIDGTVIEVATEKHFMLKRTSFNQVVLTLVKELQGPQEIQINLNMKLYHNGQYEGSAIAKLLILVSKYDF